MTVPEIDLTDPAVLFDPFTAYGEAREAGPLARMTIPGLGTPWVVTRHEDAKAVLNDPRFELNSQSFLRPPGIPEHCLRYLRTMSEFDGPEHTRLRRLAAPAFTARRAEEFRPRVRRIVDALLDALPAGEVDLLAEFARPLPMEVICELVGIPEVDRPQWREWGAAVAGGFGPAFIEVIPKVVAGARAAVARCTAEPGDDLISTLLRTPERLTETELVTLVWHLVLAGQTPTNLIANAVEVLLAHPAQLAALRADPSLMSRAVEELTRLTGPQLLATPRYAKQDVAFGDVVIREGEPVITALVSANRDPRAFTDPERLDLARTEGGHLSYSFGPHFCLGAAFARAQTEEALSALLSRFPELALAGPLERSPDPGTWRLASLPVRL
ncbi:cytochrome P450 [Actinosynnema sp. NPDC047251]|uniref:Cytochrome P450, 107B1 family n=1 Tax=Saccharothrix espanaensis (strain ATCC 51144 / DSM 44229 / JCM 9112 / NBRC 15066 / NRRL 15764) TaxID=1179773 RepID=K0JYK1_SACES|nr:cytochrome P450 [Saccharothrix espanaensis]CCH30382.1 Cytochrome P450, 107B1 family [Saccharothrix espanaensis DSM 44229]